MEVLFTTPQSVYYYNFDNQKLMKVLDGDSEYYGLTWNAKDIFVSSSKKSKADLGTIGAYKQGAIGSVFSHDKKIELDFSLIHPHQITVDRSMRHLVICDSGNNRLVIAEPNENNYKIFKPTIHAFDITEQNSRIDRQHFNSVYFSADNRFLFVVAHNHVLMACIYKYTWPELELVHVIPANTGWTHNVYEDDSYGLLVCNTFNQSLYSLDSNTTIWQDPFANFLPRGLAASQEHFVIGLSAYATQREYRHVSPGGLALVNKETLKTEELIVIPGIGQVHEVRLISERDYAHSDLKAPKGAINQLIKQGVAVNEFFRWSEHQVSVAPFNQKIKKTLKTKARSSFKNKLFKQAYLTLNDYKDYVKGEIIRTESVEDTIRLKLAEMPYYAFLDPMLNTYSTLVFSIKAHDLQLLHKGENLIGQFVIRVFDAQAQELTEYCQATMSILSLVQMKKDFDFMFQVSIPKEGIYTVIITWEQIGVGIVNLNEVSGDIRFFRNYNVKIKSF